MSDLTKEEREALRRDMEAEGDQYDLGEEVLRLLDALDAAEASIEDLEHDQSLCEAAECSGVQMREALREAVKERDEARRLAGRWQSMARQAASISHGSMPPHEPFPWEGPNG